MVSITFGYELLPDNMCMFRHTIKDNNFEIVARCPMHYDKFREQLKAMIVDCQHMLEFAYESSSTKQQFLIFDSRMGSLIINYSISRDFFIGVLIKPYDIRNILKLCISLYKKFIDGIKSYEDTVTVNATNEEESGDLQLYPVYNCDRTVLVLWNSNIKLYLNCYRKSFCDRYGPELVIVENHSYIFRINKDSNTNEESVIFKYIRDGENSFSLKFKCEKLIEKYRKEGMFMIEFPNEAIQFILMPNGYHNEYDLMTI